MLDLTYTRQTVLEDIVDLSSKFPICTSIPAPSVQT